MFEYLPIQNSDQYYSFASKYSTTVDQAGISSIQVPAPASASSSNWDFQQGFDVEELIDMLDNGFGILNRKEDVS